MYYYGPDRCKAYVEKCVDRVHERVREALAAAKAWANRLHLATRVNELIANVSPAVDAAKATVNEFCTKTFVPAVRTAAERCAGEVKAVTDKVGPTVTLVVDRCTGHVVAITETVEASVRAAAGGGQAAPHRGAGGGEGPHRRAARARAETPRRGQGQVILGGELFSGKRLAPRNSLAVCVKKRRHPSRVQVQRWGREARPPEVEA